jgi:hypothetical protein
MIKFDLGDQFVTIVANVWASINVLMLRCKQLLVNYGESLNLPITNFSPTYGRTTSFNLKKNALYEYDRNIYCELKICEFRNGVKYSIGQTVVFF